MAAFLWILYHVQILQKLILSVIINDFRIGGKIVCVKCDSSILITSEYKSKHKT